MADNTIDLITRFLADTKDFDAGIDRLGNNLTVNLNKELEKSVKQLKKLELAAASAMAALEGGDISEQSLKNAHQAIIQYDAVRKKILQTNQDISKVLRLDAKVMRQEAASITDDYKQALIGQLNYASGLIGGFSATGLALGTGLVGGIFAGANKYVSSAKVANEITLEWKKSQDSLNKSGERVGAVLAREALPLLRQAARLASEAAGFVESHPEIVRAALNAGLITAGIGAIGVAVSKGIKLYADAIYLTTVGTQLTAAKLMDTAADKQLLAAGYTSRGIGLGKAAQGAQTGGEIAQDLRKNLLGTGGMAAVVGQVVVLLGSFAAGLVVADKAFDALEGRDYKFADYVTQVKQGIAIDAKRIADFFANGDYSFKAGQQGLDPNTGNEVFRKVATALGLLKNESDEAANSLDNLSHSISESAERDAIVKAYQDYKEADKELVRNHYRERDKIIQDALAAERASNSKFASDVTRVRTNLSSALGKAYADFQRNEEKAQQDYAEQRSQIIRDSGEEIRNIETTLQEDLRKLKQDSLDKERELTANRDALGLAKQRESYNQEHDERIREANQEIAQRRRDLAVKLNDLQASFVREREQRYAEYQARSAELRANAEAEIKQLQEQHAEELRNIRQQRIDRIKELNAQLQDEQKRRREALIATIRDLDAALLGEERLREQYYAATLRELDAFLNAYKTKASSLTGAVLGNRALGGYVNDGLYKLHQGEFVLNPATTRLLESMIGTQLTQGNVAGNVNNNRSISLTDQRRFDSSLGAAERRAIKKDTEELLLQFTR